MAGVADPGYSYDRRSPKKSNCTAIFFESGVEPANHANGREKETPAKNIIRANSRYSRADLFRLLFVSIRG